MPSTAAYKRERTVRLAVSLYGAQTCNRLTLEELIAVARAWILFHHSRSASSCWCSSSSAAYSSLSCSLMSWSFWVRLRSCRQLMMRLCAAAATSPCSISASSRAICAPLSYVNVILRCWSNDVQFLPGPGHSYVEGADDGVLVYSEPFFCCCSG